MSLVSRRTARVLLAALLVLLPATAWAQQETQPGPLFREAAVLSLRLEAPFQPLLRSRGEDPPYFPATLIYAGEDGEAALPLRVRTRGNLRKRADICRFPPLMLNFPRSQTQGTPFAGENR